MTKVLITYYSSYGHIFKMAQSAAEALKDNQDFEVKLSKIPELEAARKGMSSQAAYVEAQKAQADIKEATHADLEWADGIVWGIPTRFGNMPAQVKQFIDTAGGLWAKGALEGKVTGIMSSTNTVHGGQESTILSSLIPLLHLGMIFVGSPYGENKELSEFKLQGGTPYGPSTIAGGDGSQMPTDGDLNMAKRLAERVAKVASGVKEVY
ncbi:NAD(P)H:quinone oxidoreductase [Halanaerobium sp. Z-7514]|uniref:NAD(P)H:quinone oxidoreductase n=1 Tax=Halanaerobium polyolivorans TaxID=2886943 RepID=A0AAW4WVW4_9FIRM|nr:NAD(P)H:quinone oxidoreductase [Halanaerobium polyolivorans]MCC3143921.1 NAD(P)H:quinone oxidoreductase [Halanaerobium polyolivorans]RQD78299.1 MAG: NAD(P)H:quinone oxidoreductase [Halanaerobium sp. MSAO_Bac5]